MGTVWDDHDEPAAWRIRIRLPFVDRYRRMKAALEEIDRYGCVHFYKSIRCFDPGSGKTRGHPEGAYAWCDACIARDALS